jgi:hypothetical protein
MSTLEGKIFVLMLSLLHAANAAHEAQLMQLMEQLANKGRQSSQMAFNPSHFKPGRQASSKPFGARGPASIYGRLAGWDPAWRNDYTGAAVRDDTPDTLVSATPAAAGVKAKAKPKRKQTATGLFAPAVLTAKQVMGETELQKLRANIIKKHTKVISNFIDTSESKFGQLVLKRMFEAADKDGNGTLDKEEIREALSALGFTFVKDSDMDKLMKTADMDDNEVIDFEEFIKATPKALRGNLVKLAKQNGHDLGFLA